MLFINNKKNRITGLRSAVRLVFLVLSNNRRRTSRCAPSKTRSSSKATRQSKSAHLAWRKVCHDAQRLCAKENTTRSKRWTSAQQNSNKTETTLHVLHFSVETTCRLFVIMSIHRLFGSLLRVVRVVQSSLPLNDWLEPAAERRCLPRKATTGEVVYL